MIFSTKFPVGIIGTKRRMAGQYPLPGEGVCRCRHGKAAGTLLAKAGAKGKTAGTGRQGGTALLGPGGK